MTNLSTDLQVSMNSSVAIYPNQTGASLPLLTPFEHIQLLMTNPSLFASRLFGLSPMILTALFPIYIASHAALSRPTSAARRKRPKKASRKEQEDDEDDEEEANPEDIRGASDAIVLPLISAVVLGTLYYALKYMEDGVKKTLKIYFAMTSILATAALLGESFKNITSFVFPASYSVGQDSATYDAATRQYKISAKDPAEQDRVINSPLPGFLRLIPLPMTLNSLLGQVRKALTAKGTVTFHMRYIGTVQFKMTILDATALALSLGISCYQAFMPSPWQLTNLVAFAFGYFLISTVQQTAPATAVDTSLLLLAFLVYDLIMVFYTPLMLGVAKHLKDSPNMLAIPRGGGKMSQLGLGDVGLPGMAMAFALQFDLYLHYLKMQKPPTKEGEEPTKVVYKPVTGGWGERFWTSKNARSEALKAKSFPKTYFHATVIGYTLGMVVCMVCLEFFQHGQPALIYLVPGVLGGLWGTALVKGELKLLWNYSPVERDEKTSKGKGSVDSRNNDKKPTEDLADEHFKSDEEETDIISEPTKQKKDEEEKSKEKDNIPELTPELRAIAEQHLFYLAVKLPKAPRRQESEQSEDESKVASEEKEKVSAS